ncbi:hypothetical protein C8R47DRAFT_1073414 [Mycena vitilis]|nr:hypothetical protein C8R47DRAFT_1073414 [Mycena vitilis]
MACRNGAQKAVAGENSEKARVQTADVVGKAVGPFISAAWWPGAVTNVTHWMPAAYSELRAGNKDGKLLTWEHETECWVQIARPHRITSPTNSVPIAASGLKNIWLETNTLFFCPHTCPSGMPYDPLVLRLHGLYEGQRADFFYAKDHLCIFKVVVQPLRPSQTLITWEQQHQFQEDRNRELSDGTEDELSTPSSSQGSTSTQASSTAPSSSSSSTSATSASSATSNASTLSRLAVKALLTPHPRYSSPTTLSSPVLPTPIGSGTQIQCPDVHFMEHLFEISTAGVSEDDPSCHPAWNEDERHDVLQVYDSRIYPNCFQKTSQFLQFLYKPLGQVIRDLNSPLGVPFSDYTTLIHQCCGCASCLNQFTPDGYNAHIRDGRCTNHPKLEFVEEVEIEQPEVRLRTFRDDKRPEKVKDTLDSAVGCALLQWNSRLGVPSDVWLLVSGATVLCKECDLVRAFAAHRLHLNNEVHLDAILASSILREPYVPIGQGRLEPDSIVARYLMTHSASDPIDEAVYLPGYLGEYHEGTQLGVSLLGDPERTIEGYYRHPQAPLPIPAGVAAPVAANPVPVAVNPAPVITRALHVSAGVQVETPYPFLPLNGLSILNLLEARLTNHIARGQGLSKEEVMILLSPCPSCTQYFLHRTIEEHYKECTLPRQRES